MRFIKTTASAGMDIRKAEQAARAAVGTGAELSLVAWYDATRKTGGPLEVCAHEPVRCVESYAESHDAEYRVQVDGGSYEFFFTGVPDDVAQFERDAVLASHAGLPQDQFENIQGG
jgi:hypothetical protein